MDEHDKAFMYLGRPQWEKDRLHECDMCPWKLGSGDRAVCSQSGATISKKARIEEEECPKERW